MTKINILRFTHLDQRSFLRFLREQLTPEFAISIPKRKTPADGAHAMFEEYFTATYVGQLLSRASEDLSYVLPDQARPGSFCYLIEAGNLNALSRALTYIAGGYSQDDSDLAEHFHCETWSFVDRMDEGEEIACGEYLETANQWANVIAAEYETRNGDPKERLSPDSPCQDKPPTGFQPPVQEPADFFTLPNPDTPTMNSLHIPEFFGYDYDAILDFLQLQEGSPFRLLVPKRTALGQSTHREIAEEYMAVAYIAQLLHQAGARYQIDYPALSRTGDFVFEGQTDNLPGLAALLYQLVRSYEAPKLETSDLYVQALYMLARTPGADIHCTEYHSIACQFWHMNSVESEQQNNREKEEAEGLEDEAEID